MAGLANSLGVVAVEYLRTDDYLVEGEDLIWIGAVQVKPPFGNQNQGLTEYLVDHLDALDWYDRHPSIQWLGVFYTLAAGLLTLLVGPHDRWPCP